MNNLPRTDRRLGHNRTPIFKRSGSDVDAHVASRLKAARLLAGLSQEKAAEHLGLTFQQLQKYEKGINRVAAGRLLILANLYGVPTTWLFEGAPGFNGAASSRDISAEFFATHGAAELARDFLAIPDASGRGAVQAVASALSQKSRQ